MSAQQPDLLKLEERPANTVEDLLRAAQEASAAIERAELEVLAEEQTLGDLRRDLERIETNVTIRIAALKVDPEDPESKFQYTNDVQRKAAVARTLERDQDYRAAMSAMVAAETAQKARRIHIQRLERDFQVVKLNLQFFIAIRQGD